MLRALAALVLAVSADSAMVAQVEGRGFVTLQGAPERPLALFDWVPEGARLRVDAGSVTLAFSSGRRFRVATGGKARVDADGLAEASGDVEPLDPVPPLPAMPGSMSRSLSEVAGATAVRSLPFPWIYPRTASTLADATTLLSRPPG